MHYYFDIAIIGSGFGGSLLAMIARRLGRSVVLLEKFRHPRFAIGESATPLANLLLEELARRYDLPRLLPLTKWGSWQRAYPEIACGLKRGFTFYHHRFRNRFTDHSDHRNQLLVAASPHDGIADTHWYRADFDHFLLCEAQKFGVEYFDQVTINHLTQSGDEFELVAERNEKPLSIRAGFLVDATGPRGFLHRIFQLPEILSPMPPTQGLYTHFSNVRRLSDMEMHSSEEMPPYPIDDAAVHHVFDGGWIWVLRFNNGITSAGVAAVDTLAQELRFEKGAVAWEYLLRRLPTVAEQFVEAKAELPFIHAPRLSFRSGVVVGSRWALLPSAAGFVDPLLSTGFPLTLLGIARLAEIIEIHPAFANVGSALKTYEEQTLKELAATEWLVSALYANMNDFSLFTSLSMLYFAAASFAEATRRLGRPHLANSFLLTDHPVFGPQVRSILQKAMGCSSREERTELVEEIKKAIEPINVAGLSNNDRRNWYPVDAADLLNAAGKLGVSEQQIQQYLHRSGFFIERETYTTS